MRFENNFFESEEREGFFVSSKMKHAWAAQMEVLADIDRVCVKHNIQYFAGFGTLLGAVRHKGFIPWDDDMDLFMLRKDYDRFWQNAAKDLPSVYITYNMHTSPLREACYWTRVISGQYTRLDNDYLNKYHGFPYVTGVDIFPIDAYPHVKRERDTQQMLLNSITGLINITWSIKNHSPDTLEKLQMLEDICGTKLTKDPDELPWDLLKLRERLVTGYRLEENEISEIGIVTTGWPPIPKECFSVAVPFPFEHINIPIPQGYEQVLIALYGKDYMTPKQMLTHNYPFYAGQEKKFYEEHGFYPDIKAR